MDKGTFSVRVDMNINLPEGDTEVNENEKCAIIDRIHHYLTDIGTTSDDYEGCLAGKVGKRVADFELLVSEVRPQDPTESLKIFDSSTKLSEFKAVQDAAGYASFLVDIGTLQNVATLGSIDALNEACSDDIFELGHLMEDLSTEFHSVTTGGGVPRVLAKVTAHVDNFIAEWESLEE